MAFADVLDETLAVYSTTEGLAVPPPTAPAYTRPLGFFLFNAATHPATPGALTAAARPATAPVAVPVRRASFVQAKPQHRRPAPRLLSAGQRTALHRLVELGAEIQPDFTSDELRSAYRRLARRYHPDHHPETNDAQKRELARLFTQLRDSYAELQDALAPAA